MSGHNTMFLCLVVVMCVCILVVALWSLTSPYHFSSPAIDSVSVGRRTDKGMCLTLTAHAMESMFKLTFTANLYFPLTAVKLLDTVGDYLHRLQTGNLGLQYTVYYTILITSLLCGKWFVI